MRARGRRGGGGGGGGGGRSPAAAAAAASLFANAPARKTQSPPSSSSSFSRLRLAAKRACNSAYFYSSLPPQECIQKIHNKDFRVQCVLQDDEAGKI